jgi:phosphate transport system substrate-binding protein
MQNYQKTQELLVKFMVRKNNEIAVSPIVATLVLIIVAVIGAVAVGTIMGTFSTDVSKQGNAERTVGASQTEIIVAGSDTIDPITQAAAKSYSVKNPGIKISSQIGGSNGGIEAIGNGIADIGAIAGPFGGKSNYLSGVISHSLPTQWTQRYPNLQQHQIGVGVVVPITNHAYPVNATGQQFWLSDFRMLFNASGSEIFTVTPAMVPNPVTVIRADNCPTATAFLTYISLDWEGQTFTSANPATKLVTGNKAMVSTVGSTPYSVGYADYSDAVAAASGSNPTIDIMDTPYDWGARYYLPFPVDTSANVTKNWESFRNLVRDQYQFAEQHGFNNITQDILDADAETSNGGYSYPIPLFRPLYYFTNGEQSSVVENFINFVQVGPIDTNSHEDIFEKTNNFGIADIS